MVKPALLSAALLCMSITASVAFAVPQSGTHSITTTTVYTHDVSAPVSYLPGAGSDKPSNLCPNKCKQATFKGVHGVWNGQSNNMPEVCGCTFTVTKTQSGLVTHKK